MCACRQAFREAGQSQALAFAPLLPLAHAHFPLAHAGLLSYATTPCVYAGSTRLLQCRMLEQIRAAACCMLCCFVVYCPH